jgi:DNA-binding NarL/FixJ family response regulator
MKFNETTQCAGGAAETLMRSPAPVRVFLVEDLQRLQVLMADLLRSQGDFTLVGTAGTEAEAISWLAEHPDGWDLAVIDLVLEQGCGIGVVARCRGRREGAKVVVFSEYVTPVIGEHCLSLGADAAILKSDIDAFVGFCRTFAR